MATTPDYLDALTNCLLNIFSLQSESPSSESWLSRSAQEIRKVILPEGIVTLFDVQRGSLVEPWGRTNLGISTADTGLTSIWHEYFTSVLESQGIDTHQIILRANKLQYSHYNANTTNDTDIAAKIFQAYALKFNVAAVHAYTGPLIVHPWITTNKRILNLTLWIKPGLEDPLHNHNNNNNNNNYNYNAEIFMRNLWTGVNNCYVNTLEKGIDQHQPLMASLTKAQKRVAELLLTGISEQQIAEKLDRTKYTIHDHIKAIYRAWKVCTRGEFMAKWSTLTQIDNPEESTVESDLSKL